MTLAYVLNAYPMTSTTFIRREIEAHERAGVPVLRFAIRTWDQALVDPADIAEAGHVSYLLDRGVGGLMKALLKEIPSNPIGFARAFSATLRMFAHGRGTRPKMFVYLLEAIELRRRLAAAGVTHVHTHFSTNSATVAMLSHLLGGPAYTMTVHGPDELLDMTGNSLALKVRNARAVAVITDYCQGVVDRHTGGRYTDKLHVVRCGLDLGEFTEVTPVPATQDIVCVGRLCAAKTQVLQVEAMAEIVRRHPEARLILIGDGDTRPQIEARIRAEGLEDRVILAGWKSNPEVRKALAAARALSLPSLAEGLPVVIMESFALGRPVVTTTITGIPELVDESCGWLAAPGDRASLVRALDALFSADPARLTEMGQEGRRRVVAQHDQDRNAADLRQLFPPEAGGPGG